MATVPGCPAPASCNDLAVKTRGSCNAKTNPPGFLLYFGAHCAGMRSFTLSPVSQFQFGYLELCAKTRIVGDAAIAIPKNWHSVRAGGQRARFSMVLVGNMPASRPVVQPAKNADAVPHHFLLHRCRLQHGPILRRNTRHIRRNRPICHVRRCFGRRNNKQLY